MTETDILIVEDDTQIAQLLCDFLRAKGYVVSIAGNGEKAMKLYEQYGARLVILDMMLPEMDGLDILTRIRRESNTPVIIASAKNTKENKLDGLLAGADDYIEKPYDIDILLAKIDGIFKRRYAKDIISAGEIQIDRQGKQVFCENKPIDMTVKEYELLLLLMENKGKVLSKEYLFREIWGSDSDTELQTVTVHIKWLRSKLEQEPKKPRHIITVWGVGYKFE